MSGDRPGLELVILSVKRAAKPPSKNFITESGGAPPGSMKVSRGATLVEVGGLDGLIWALARREEEGRQIARCTSSAARKISPLIVAPILELSCQWAGWTQVEVRVGISLPGLSNLKGLDHRTASKWRIRLKPVRGTAVRRLAVHAPYLSMSDLETLGPSNRISPTCVELDLWMSVMYNHSHYPGSEVD